jgi:hypothetical protein
LFFSLAAVVIFLVEMINFYAVYLQLEAYTSFVTGE